jgi:hypothetical protein
MKSKLALLLLSLTVLGGCGKTDNPAPAPSVPAQTNAPAAGMSNATATISTAAAATAVQTAATPPATAESAKRYDAQQGSKVRMDGTSTIHDWYAESPTISGFMEVPPGFQIGSLKPGPTTARAEATIPVRTLRSSSGKPMDKIMFEHMKAARFPRIEYRLRELVLLQPPAAGAAAQFDSTGELVVTGVTNTIKMPVTIEAPDATKLRVKGAIPLKMTQFGIKPPELEILGKIVTGDDIKILFDWVLAAKP